MTKYHVPVFRVLVSDIEADSPEEACQKAEHAVDFNNFNQPGIYYTDEVREFLVDVDGDTEYEHTTWCDTNYNPIREELPADAKE